MASVTFTDTEVRLITICFKHMKGPLNIDFAEVAVEYGYKDARIARSKFNAVRAKCKPKAGETGEADHSEETAPAPKANKRKANTDGDVADGAKRTRKKPRTATRKTKDANEEENIKEEAETEDMTQEKP